MRKNLIFYSMAFALIFLVFIFFNRLYRELIRYSELTNRTTAVSGIYQNISTQVRNAAVSNPDIDKAGEKTKSTKLFLTDRQSVTRQLDLLLITVPDPVN